MPRPLAETSTRAAATAVAAVVIMQETRTQGAGVRVSCVISERAQMS